MKMTDRIRKRNLALNIAAIVAASSITAYSWAAPDYDRIRKDINVMVGIVKSAFQDNSDCQRCSVRISGHYLADQGVVFNVDPASGRYEFVYDDDIELVTRGVVAGIPGMVSDILDNVHTGLEMAEKSYAWEWHTDDDVRGLDREAREELREARRELREASRELREVTIEMIHAEDDELQDLRRREKEIEGRVADIESKQQTLESKMTEQVEQRVRERELRLAERREQRHAEIRKVEDIVLNTFCDYSRTMRSIPKNEKVSIIVKKDGDSSDVFVFDQDELASCDSTRGSVRDHALSYVF